MLQKILTLFFLLPMWAMADDVGDCANVFDQIDQSCVEFYKSKFKKGSINLNNISNDEVFFYKTGAGNLGKLKIIAKEVRQGECSLYWESETFSKPTSFKTNTNITISNQIGLWSKREVNLDPRSDDYDFVLLRKDASNECRLEVLGGTVVSRYQVLSETPAVTGSSLIYFAAIACIAVAVFVIAFSFLKEEAQISAQEKLDEHNSGAEKIDARRYGIILKYSKPLFSRHLVETVGRMEMMKKIKEKYKRPLANAGLQRVLNPVELFSFKLFLILLFPILFIIFRWLLEANWTISLIPLVALLGYVYPDIWMKSQTQKRREEIFLAMPFIVDMLALSIEAGLDFMGAISRVVEKAPQSALTDEFQVMLKEIKIGSSRAEALRQLSWRVDEISVNSFCATLIAADSVGASVGPVLKSLSKELRQKRSTLVEKKAAQAASKIMLPMILVILPAVFIIVMVPPLMEFFI